MKAGAQFVHNHFLTVHQGVRSNAIMKITRVTKGTVYYTYADSGDNKGRWRMSRDVFVERYGHQFPS